MESDTENVLESVRSGKMQAWWCLDTYLMAHLAELLTKLRDNGHGYPPKFADIEGWNETLTKLIRAFQSYDVNNPDAYGSAQDALHYVADHLHYFWD